MSCYNVLYIINLLFKVRVICLVRESLNESVEKRVKNSLRKFKLYSDDIGKQLKCVGLNKIEL